jgi:hypothetical protein
MSPEEERALRDLAQAGRGISAIRAQELRDTYVGPRDFVSRRDPQYLDRLGSTLGDADLNAESSLIRRDAWRNPKNVGDFERFVRTNFEPKDHIAIGRLDFSIADPKLRMKQAILPAEELVSDRWQRFLRHANVSGQNIHISLNTFQPGGRRTKADVLDIRHLAIEIDKDGKGAVDRIAQSGPPAHNVFESSHGKYHVWWKVSGFDAERAEAATRGLIRTFGGDPAASDVTRMLRAPGFTNRKPEYAGLERPHWVREVSRTEGKEYPLSTFSQYLEIGRERLHLPARDVQVTRARGGVDRSAQDWAWTKDELKRGRDPGSVAAELASNRSDKPSPKYYSEHTVERALEAIRREPRRGR